MSKHFNGRKMSHTGSGIEPAKCALCGNQMKMFLGRLRCTEMRRGESKTGNMMRVVKHGSLNTIRKRIKRQPARV